MTAKQQRARFDAENLRAAEIILSEPHRHAAVMVEWARLVLVRVKPNQQPKPNQESLWKKESMHSKSE